MALSQLKLNAVKKQPQSNPVTHRRHKLLRRLEEQAALARAQAIGSRYAPEKTRVILDPATGERRSVTVQKRVKPWWFDADNGRLALTVRYGSTVLELAKGKYSVDVGDITQVADTIAIVADAVAAGELDTQIATAASTLRKGFKKAQA